MQNQNRSRNSPTLPMTREESWWRARQEVARVRLCLAHDLGIDCYNERAGDLKALSLTARPMFVLSPSHWRSPEYGGVINQAVCEGRQITGGNGRKI